MRYLYRTILKLHAVKLAPEQRELGDKFVKAEFRRHMTANEKYSSIFYAAWCDYVAQLERGVLSRDLTNEERALLNPEQKKTLRELRSHVVRAKHTDPDFVL